MKKILIVEDSSEILENMAELLQLEDYTILTAVNGAEGIEQAVSHKPDLVLCDIMMPEMDGYEMLSQIKMKEATKNIPFIFVTASAQRDEIKTGLESGADNYITKPFDSDELFRLIKLKIGSPGTL